MNIQKINQINLNPVIPAKTEKKQEQVSFAANNTTTLPSIYTTGQSQINSNIPVAYAKIAEIPIPGLNQNASVFKLANGQKVIICPKKGPTYIKTTYNVGSLNEPDNIRGISHYIEHNLFNGSKELAPREYDKRISNLGGRPNASTSYNYTDYYLMLQLLNEDSLEEAIKLNAMQTQYPTFPQEQLLKEKEIVKEEIDKYLDMPVDVATSTATNNLYNIPTVATNAVIGTKETINGLTRDKVLEYYNTWYTPDNAVTVVTGDVDVNKTIELVSKYYNKKNDYSQIDKRHYNQLTPINSSVREDIILQNASSANISLAFAIPEGTSKEDRIKIKALLTYINSENSNLSKALEKYGTSPYFYSEKLQNKPDGASAILGNISVSEHQVEDVLQIIYAEITNIANNPPSQKDLDGTKKFLSYVNNNISEESDLLNNRLTNMVLEEDLNYFANNAAAIQQLTPQDLSNIARQFLDLNKVSLCVAHAKDSTPAMITDNYYDAKNNVQAKTVSFGSSAKIYSDVDDIINNVTHYKLINNIETRILQTPPTSKSNICMSFSTNELNDVSEPAFALLNTMLNRGNAIRGNDNVLEMKQEKDLSLAFSSRDNGLAVAAEFYVQDTQDAISLINETLMNPNFTQAEFDRAKQIIRDNILTIEPSANDNVNIKLFGDKLKSYSSKEELLKQLEALTLSDIQILYSRILSTAQVTASINSPINEYPHLQDLINNSFASGLPMFRPVTKDKSPGYHIYQPITKSETIVEANERKQADIVQTYTFKKSQNIDDQAKIKVLEQILGGGMSSRLFNDLREEQKLSYSVGAGCSYVKDTGMMQLFIETTTESNDPNEGSPENARKALDGFNKHVNKIKTENVSEQELETAKLTLKTSILNSLETNSDKLINIHYDSDTLYDIRYTKELLAAIDRITADDVRAAANYVFANPSITSIVASQNTLNSLGIK